MAKNPSTEASDANVVAADRDETETDAIAQIQTLPRVASIEVRASPTRVEVKEVPEPQKANIHIDLKPFTPTPRKTMVTMSDIGGFGRARGDVQPARNKRRD